MEIKIMVDMLTKDSVSIVKQKYTIVDGVEYSIGQPSRKDYMNSTERREQLKNEVAEPYLSAIMAMWGTTPTITETTTTS